MFAHWPRFLSILLAVWPFASRGQETVIRMLVPGFTAQELPVRLPNINNLRFASDGRLTALGYNGKVWLLRDADGDGLEDTAEMFWDKPTLSVPVGMCWSTAGLFVSSHGKLSLLHDADGDGKADTEEIVASGWPPTDVATGGTDAMGVTLDGQGNLYFGLLTPDYSNPYRVTNGVARYDVNGIRGTIQKLNLATRKMETVASGIRVPFALAFNKAGDLFNTDQEGETWCPGGNPLDELNHIIPGRNYGFPPRHEKYLPNLVSEPPIVAFGPQHESTCGLVFNEPHGPANPKPETRTPKPILPVSPAQGLFGPKWWAGDALVAGESRGKIWRVRLAKTPHGYVGKAFLIARLSMLTMDLAVSPKGDLYVCCHSGLPDWGTGPNGEGKIFKISYTDPKAPQPVMVWAASPTAVRVAFDKPIDPSVTSTVVGEQIEFGKYVRAADRYEVLKPPYQVVRQQDATPRGKLKIVSGKLDNDNQTLVLTTEPHRETVTYALTIPGVKANGRKIGGETVELDYDLGGALASFGKLPSRRKSPLANEVGDSLRLSDSYRYVWTGWLPAADRKVADGLGYPYTLWRSAEKAARLGKGDIFSVSFELNLPPEGLILHARASSRVSVRVLRSGKGGSTVGFGSLQGAASRQRDPDGRFTTVLDFAQPPHAVAVPVQLHVSAADGVTDIELYYSTKNDPALRPLPLDTFYAPWPTLPERPQAAAETNANLVGGDFERGRSLFFGDRLKCSTCHRLRGEGGTIGPDLSNLVSRDAASVLRDIKEPSASIHPDYVAYNVAFQDGNEITGFIRTQNAETLGIIGADGKETTFRPTDVKEMRPSAVSLMPAGLLDGLSEEQTLDLLVFLLSEPPKRDEAAIERLLRSSGNRESEIENRNLNIVLVASKQDHGPGQHDYPAWQNQWMKLLGRAPNAAVTNAWLWPTPEQFAQSDLLVFYCWNHDWNGEKFRQLDEFLARGGGIVLFHSATIADKEPDQLAERIGLAAQPQRSKYRHCPFDLQIVAPDENPITRGLPRQIHLLDEPYWPMIGDASRVEVLATAEMESEARPMIWTFQKGKGRVFASIAGHYSWTFDDPLFQIIALRGLAWAAGEDPRRFQVLATGPQNQQ